MARFVKGDGRTHIESGLMRESLVSQSLVRETHAAHVVPMVPEAKLVAIGGQSILDRGAEAVLPLVDAIVALKPRHKMILGVGGGARARHTYAIGMDLGLPVGGLARIVGSVEEQNRNILQFLLAPHGGITFIKDHFQDLQLFLSGGMIPICIGQPPYHFWEPPPREGRLPENGPDVGLFLQSEIIGVERLVYLKDVDGIYTDDPRKNPRAELIPEITAKALLEMDLPDLPIERELLRTMENARLVTSFQLVNGLKPELLGRALDGEHVGTIVRASGEGAGDAGAEEAR
jgi:molybdenum storage protein